MFQLATVPNTDSSSANPATNLTFYVPGGELTTYGNLDVSFDVIAKGLGGKLGRDGNPPVGNMGWMPDVSTNLSYIGIRGFQSVRGLPFNFLYQLETQLEIAATSGSAESNANQSNVVKGALTSRNSYIGITAPRWGSLMLGKTDAPYKNSTAKFNPNCRRSRLGLPLFVPCRDVLLPLQSTSVQTCSAAHLFTYGSECAVLQCASNCSCSDF